MKWLAIGAALLLLILASSSKAEAQVDCVKWQDASDVTVGNFCAPFKVKAGNNVTFSKSGTVLTITGVASVGGAGGSNTQIQFNSANVLAGSSGLTGTTRPRLLPLRT
jgi:hypothetical protein